jgi:hypothetical protein
VVEFFHKSAGSREMIDGGAQEEEEVMRVEEKGVVVQGPE